MKSSIIFCLLVVISVLVYPYVFGAKQETGSVETEIFYSPELGLRFEYPRWWLSRDNKFHVDVIENTAYLNLGPQTVNESYWVRVYNKKPSLTLAEAIKNDLLAKYPKCKVESTKDSASLFGPNVSDNPMSDLARGDLKECPEGLVAPFSGFRYDPDHPTSYIFVRSSEDAILLPDGRSWTNTIEILGR